jgi:hypothetical protein
MERLPMFMDGRINIVKIAIITKSEIYIQCNSHQNSNIILQKVVLKLIWKHKKTSNSQRNPKQKEECWRYNNI